MHFCLFNVRVCGYAPSISDIQKLTHSHMISSLPRDVVLVNTFLFYIRFPLPIFVFVVQPV